MFSKISILIRTGKTVFSFNEICLNWFETDYNRASVKIHYYVKKGELINIRNGLYALNENYDRLESANKLYKPSYISLETVLFKNNIIFQYNSSIFLLSYLSREIIVNGDTYVYKKIKDTALCNPLGIITGKYSIANTERAILDSLYTYSEYYFDNLNTVNWDRLFEYSEIYERKNLKTKIDKLYKKHNKNA